MFAGLTVVGLTGLTTCFTQLSTSVASQQAGSGQQLVLQAAAHVFHQQRLEAKIRQSVHLFGQELGGEGSYAQLGDGSGRVRLELQLSIGGKIARLQQICDGRFLYVRQDLPERNDRTFIDLERVLSGVDESDSSAMRGTTNWMAFGGLSHLLLQLDKYFQFEPASPSQLGDVPVWITRGTWKANVLARLLPHQKEDILSGRPARIDQLPPHLPHIVVLTLSRDRVFPLFPYQIVYHRYEPAADRGGGAKAQDQVAKPIFTLELFDVQHRQEMHPAEFEYKPDDHELVDHTDAFLRTHGQSPSPPTP